MKIKRTFNVVVISLSFLLIPFVIMNFSDEVNWSPGDFVIAGVFLAGLGLAIDFVLRKLKNRKYRFAILFGVIAMAFLIWAELAVGLLESAIRSLIN